MRANIQHPGGINRRGVPLNKTGEKAVYQNAPSFAYHIGAYAVDKIGTLTNPIDHAIINWLANEGFTAE